MLDIKEHPISFVAARDKGLLRGVGIHVVDGDTYDVQVDAGFNLFFTLRLRIFGINAPEIYGVKKTSDEYAAGIKAKDYCIPVIEDQYILLRSHGFDGKYGRWIADVLVHEGVTTMPEAVDDFIDLATDLMDEGLAVQETY